MQKDPQSIFFQVSSLAKYSKVIPETLQQSKKYF